MTMNEWMTDHGRDGIDYMQSGQTWKFTVKLDYTDNVLIIHVPLSESEAGGLTDTMTQKIAAKDIQRVKALFLP